MTTEQIQECQAEYERAEMSDDRFADAERNRLKLYHKWFAKLLDHAHGRTNPPWLEGVRGDDKDMRRVIES